METIHLTLRPRTAFGGPIRGDTLFGQLCWAIRNRFGEARLTELLAGYADHPFAVCSDAFPKGFIPRPALPLHRFERIGDEDRKQVKRRQWLPLEAIDRPVREWLALCKTEAEAARAAGADADTREPSIAESHDQPHNSIHRQLGTTYGGEFAPYSQPQHWYPSGLQLDLWLVHDSARIGAGEVVECLRDIGTTGYGRDASTGLGKFDVESIGTEPLPRAGTANSCYTLAPCAPQGLRLDPGRSFYHPFTRFGRHGDRAVLGGRPFKNPVLLADTGALLTPAGLPDFPIIGRGLGGNGELSRAITGTVQQGYAPCIFVDLEGAA
jgi:CRISPR-associated protein Csm4